MVRLLAKKLGILKINIITSNSKSADYLYQTKYQLLGNKKSKIKTKQNPIHMHYKKKNKTLCVSQIMAIIHKYDYLVVNFLI